jgi:hypothetical protein
MNHERLTEALYDWLVASSPVVGVPLGSRMSLWREVALKDLELAERWREAVDTFLIGIGADQQRGEELAFDAYARPAPPLASEDDEGEPHRITPDGG